MTASARRARDQIDGIIIVELVHLQPAFARREFPAEPVNENALSIMVHLEQRIGEREPVLGQDDVDHRMIMPISGPFIEPRNYRGMAVVAQFYAERDSL